MLSEVPEGWSEIPFGELTSIVGGTTPKKNVEEYWDSEDVLWATPTDITFLPEASHFLCDTATKASFRAVERGGLKLLPADTVLMTSRATIGYVAIAKSEISTNQGFANFLPSEKYTPLFLLYLLQSKREQFVSSAGGSTFKEISKGVLKSLTALLPPLNEQHRIAEVLSSVDASIQATQAVIEQAERVKLGLMEELLTGGLGSEAIERGEVPEGWQIITLASDGIDLIDGDRGKQYPKSSDFSGDGYCLFLSAKNVTKHGFRFDEKQFVTKEKHESLRKGALERDDIVVTTRGTVGNVAHFNNAVPYNIVRINSGMVIVRNQSERVLTDYLFSYLASSVVDEQIKLRTHGSAQPALTIKTLKTLRVALPSLSRQQHINSILLSQNAAIAASFTQLHSLQRLKSALMDDLLTGKVRTA